MKTVAIPSIGAGHLNYPPDVVAKVLISETVSYIGKHQDTLTMEVINFVIYDKNVHDKFQEFYKSIVPGSLKVADSLMHTASPSSLKFSIEPHIFTFSHGLQLQLLQMHPSNDESDVIVTYSQTRHSKIKEEALVKIDEVESQGKLILHIKNFAHNHPEVIKLIYHCLEKAETKRYGSITFSGTVGQNTISEHLTVEAIATFIDDNNPIHVKFVRVIFQDLSPDMLQRYKEAVQKVQTNVGILKAFWNKIFKSSKPKLDTAAASYSSCATDDHNPWPADKQESPSQSEITFQIYGETAAIVSKGEESLRSSIGDTYDTEDMKGADISMLLDYESALDEIQDIAKENFVEVIVYKSSRSITMNGQKHQVIVVKQNVLRIVDALNNIHGKIQWIREISSTNEEYDKNLNYAIEKARADSNETYHCVKANFKIDFKRMEETDLITHRTVKVKRVVQAQQGIAVQFYIIIFLTFFLEVPKNWTPMPMESGGIEKDFHLVPLTVDNEEYKKVKSAFTKTMSANIISIQRLQNPLLYRQYAVQKAEMDKRNPEGHQNERWLWHGTDHDTLEKIYAQNFNRSFAGTHGTYIHVIIIIYFIL